ncbi:phenylalanine--tRNA ligase subunit beta [Buchnera aphidicola]|uniref:Phenylalanine--tRNA ligase beta subunit n=1 Tax=Buchnera aphidicola (Cinara strobi) TaxID=1921549 RepID=A0A3B1DKU8_9GAMM|nr:phenylalanine--tRNA ligase subunit beta [Buchnera aphidicola]VAX76341.1 Phenylalanine--tRNA ligase beta subunit [Buchnera aphidicola (Cinara strobi)]
MKIGAEWLRQWIDLPISNINLCKQLTIFGCEVNYIQEKKKYFSNTVIGRIVSKKKYFPDKRLILYRVRISRTKKIYIINKKKNYLSAGVQIPVILPQSSLIKDMKILSCYLYKNKISGVFCSYHLAGIEKNNKEVIIISKKLKVGSDFNHYLCSYNDIMKFFIPFNRIDLRSVWGISREIAVLNHLPLPKLKYKSRFIPKKVLSEPRININIDIKNSNIQYIFCEFYSLKVPSVFPFRMQERLRVSNLLSDNIILNIINYIFIETGHWFHVFDLDYLKQEIYIKELQEKQVIQDKNNKSISLVKGTVILSDLKNILSFEDMEYSHYSSVNSITKNLFLGSICFEAEFIQSRNLIIGVERKIEYLKYNVYPSTQKNIFQYIQNLILDICGGETTTLKKYKIEKDYSESNLLSLNINRINRVSGIKFTKKDILSILKICYFKFFSKKDNFFITPPYWRTDIRIIEDLFSEIIRIYGFEKIQSSPPKNWNLSFKHTKERISLSRIKLFLIDRGYFEIISYSFIDPVVQKFFITQSNSLSIINPISSDMSEMRLSLWIGLLNCVSYHQKRQNESIKLFETGLCFFSKKEKGKIKKVFQNDYLALAISGFYSHRSWYLKNRKFDFYDLKGDVESILNICGKMNCVEFSPENFIGLCSEQSAGIYLNGQFIGRIGVLDPSFYNVFNLHDSVILFEIMWKKICDSRSIKIKYISVLPSSQRDISIIVSSNILSKDIIDVCRNNISIKNTDIYIYDVYTGSNIPVGKKSISICFTFNSFKNTLIESDINLNISQCVTALKDKFGAILRD